MNGRAYIQGMKQIAPLLLVALMAGPVAAQDVAPGDNGAHSNSTGENSASDKSEGLSLIERGAQIFLRGLMKDLEPALEDFRTMAEAFGPQMQALLLEMGPKLEALANQIDDIRNYDAPELLPNGDIIIRRKTDAPTWTPEGDIEL